MFKLYPLPHVFEDILQHFSEFHGEIGFPELFDASEDKAVTASEFKQHIFQSIKNVFGEIGSCINVDVLRYELDKKSGILRCSSSDYVKLRSALTLAGVYQGQNCAYIVNNSSPLLVSLLSNSRQYVHK